MTSTCMYGRFKTSESARAALLGVGSSGRVGMNVNNGTAAQAGLVSLLERHYDLIDLLREVSCIGIRRKKSRKSLRSPSPWFFIDVSTFSTSCTELFHTLKILV